MACSLEQNWNHALTMSHPLHQLIGYTFKDLTLQEQALTHRSFHRTHNERLEFLGDAILNLIISDWLFKNHAGTEGELSLIRSNLVNKKTLATIGKQLKIFQYIKLGGGESDATEQKRPALVANVIEAIIGAIYLDSDIRTTQTVVLKWYIDILEHPMDQMNKKDYKSQLQEYCHKNQVSLPKYELLKTSGAMHQQQFFVAVTVGEKHCEGSGLTRKAAEQEAAKLLLEKIHD